MIKNDQSETGQPSNWFLKRRPVQDPLKPDIRCLGHDEACIDDSKKLREDPSRKEGMNAKFTFISR